MIPFVDEFKYFKYTAGKKYRQQKKESGKNIAGSMPLLPFCLNCRIRRARTHVSLPR
jgi:hypothetical protein